VVITISYDRRYGPPRSPQKQSCRWRERRCEEDKSHSAVAGALGVLSFYIFIFLYFFKKKKINKFPKLSSHNVAVTEPVR